MYRWSSCLWCQFSSVSRCAHYSLNSGWARCELRGWKETRARSPTAGRRLLHKEGLKTHLYSPGWHSNRNTASLCAGAAAIPQFSPLWLTQWTQPWGSSNSPHFMGGTHTYAYYMTKRVPRDMHALWYKWSQLLHSHYLGNMGWERLNMPSWLICSLPHLIFGL